MNLIKKALSVTAFLFAFSLPLNTKVANGCLIAFIIVSIVTICKEYKKSKKTDVLYFVFNTSAFIVLLLILGLLVTDDVTFALKYFESYSSYLILPVVFNFLQQNSLIRIKKVSFLGLFIGSVFSSLILLVVNLWHYFDYKNSLSIDTDLFGYNYTYHEFAEILGFHPTFLGIYFVFAFLIMQEFIKNKIPLLLRILCGFFLITALLFLNSRVSFLLLFVYLLFDLFRWFKKCLITPNGMFKFSAILSVIMIVLGIAIYSFKNTYIYQRMTNQLVWELSENKGTSFNGVNSSDSRISRWKAIVDKSLEKPVLGFGSASEDRVVLDVYRDNDLHYALENKYGPHNQYLSFLLEYGLLGFFIFCYYLGSNIFYQLKKKNVVSFLFFLFIGVACIFDSLLYLNAGVIFLAFFGNLFSFLNWKENN